MEKTLKKILTLVLSAAVLLSTLMCAIPVTAAKTDPATDFMVGKYGIMVHYLHDADEVQQAVDSFDAANFANQVYNAGAKWVLFTLTQDNGVYNIPMDEHLDASGNAIFADTDVTVAEGEKDIVEKLYDELTPYGIKLMLYWIPGAPSGKDETSVALATQLGAEVRCDSNNDGEPDESGNWVLNETTVNNMSAIMESVSLKYGNKVAGWWIDACYDRVEFDSDIAAQEAAALRAGNSKALVAFNNGINYQDCRFDVESYAAGEICHVNKPNISVYDYSADSRWTANGFQSHYLTFLGSNWTMGDERYNTTELVDHVYNNILKSGGAMTFDMSCSRDGTLDNEQFNQMVALSKVVNKVDTELSVDFESYNPFGWIDNVYKDEGAAGATDHYSNDSDYVQLATGDEALNGNTSLKVLPAEGNTRTDIVGATTVPSTETENGITFDRFEFDGNADFNKADAENGFDKVSGIMLRLKLTNDGDAAHAFRFALHQDGLAQPTTLGRLAKLYAADGTYLGTAASADAGLSGTIPAGFDGFVFMPFAESRSGTIIESVGYGNYNASPEVMVDFSQNFRATIWLNSSNYNGATVYIDDINFYYGNTDADAWNTMRALGYDVILSGQPDTYTLPINSENLWQPITTVTGTASSGAVVTGGTASLTADTNEVLNGKYSVKISTDGTAAIALGKRLVKATTNAINVTGVDALSTETINAKASDDYAYLKLRIKMPNASMTFHPIISQNGSYWSLAESGKAYNADGTVNSDVKFSGTYGMTLPASFDGYLYLSVYKLVNVTVGGDKNVVLSSKDSYLNNSAPDLDQSFGIMFQFVEWGSVLNDTDIYLDDIDMVVNDGNLPLDFEESVSSVLSYKGLTNNQYGMCDLNSFVSLVGKDGALNGNSSLKIALQSVCDGWCNDGISEGATNKHIISYAGIKVPALSEDNMPTGIMVRIKLEDETPLDTLYDGFCISLTNQEAKNNIVERLIGQESTKVFYADGTPYTNVSIGSYGIRKLPAGFDGFVFFPFEDWANRANVGEIDLTQDFYVNLMFYGADNWRDVTVTVDDIGYYTVADNEAGLTNTEAWSFMRELGYDIYLAEQPETYELPLDFEGYEVPFATTTAHYGGILQEDGSKYWPTKTDSNALVVGEYALTGNASLAVTVPTMDVSTSHVWAGTNYANFEGIKGLNRETLAQANSDYAYLKVRVKTPDTNDVYDVRFYLKQSGLDYETVLSNSVYTVDDDGYYLDIPDNDISCKIPGGFEGDLYFPISGAMAFISNTERAKYSTNADLMVNMEEDFQMCMQFWGANVAGQTFIIDDMEMVVNVLGDINGDNEANGTDLVIMQKQLLDVDTTYEKKCDIKEDAIINILDFIKLKKIIGK